MQPYTKAELEQQIQTCTAQLQIALTKVEQQSRRIEIIEQLVQMLHQGIAIDNLLQSTAELLASVLTVQCCFLLSINHNKNDYYLDQSHCKANKLITDYSVLYNRYKYTLSQGEPLTLSSFEGQKASILTVPILGKQNLLGVIILSACEQRIWSEEEIYFIKIIANYCVVAILQNPFSQTQEAAEEKPTSNPYRNQQLDNQIEKARLIAKVVEHTPDGFYLLDRNKRFIYVNHIGLQSLGKQETEILGRTGEELGFSPEMLVLLNERLDFVLINKQSISGDLDYIYSKTQTRKYASYVYTPIFREDNQIEQILIIYKDITELKLAEAALHKSDERFTKAFHGNPIASSLSTYPEAKFLDVNTNWLKIFGYSREEVIGRTTLELGIWNSLEERNSAVQKLQIEGRLQNFEVRFCTKFGEVRDGLLNMEVIDLNGSGILAMLLDITERKRAEVALKQSEQKYRNLVETCQGVIWTVDLQGRLTFVNQAVRQVYGYEPQEMIGHHFSEFMTFNQAQTEQKMLERVLNGESLFQYETQFLHKDGRVLYVSSNVIVQRDEAGKFLGTTGTSLDITAFKETEAALRASQAKLSTILDSAIAVIINFRVFANQDWEYDYFSSGAETMYGYTPEELIANKNLWFSRVLPEDVETIVKIAFPAIFAERTTQIEYRFRHKDETIRWHSFTIFSKRDEVADCWVVTTVDTDISVQKVTEQKLKASLQEKEALLKEVHHRVKNNLQVISSLLDFQAQHIQEPLALAAFVTSQNRVKSIALIHEKIYQSEYFAKVNLADYINSLTTHLVLTYSLNPDNIILQFKLDDVFCSLDVAIPCGLLINELVSNALKHGLPGNSKGRIWVELQFLCMNSEFNQPQFGIVVGNDGIKLSELPNVGNAESVGFQLIYALIQQLHGKLELQTSRGTEFKISFINLNG